jgi:hypothetical protein
MKKCPPGVICIENVTMFFIVICVLLVTYFIYSNLFNQKIIVNNKQTEKIVIKEPRENGILGWFNYPYNNIPKDVLLNPYSPPLRDERYFIPELNYIPPGSVPINVQTNIGAVETTYRQVGILTPLNGNEKNNILPLMGRILFNRRDLWNYYTISNQHNNVKLPISVKGRSALNENGVDKVYNGDTVYVEGVNDAYKVTIYDNDTIRYLPFI